MLVPKNQQPPKWWPFPVVDAKTLKELKAYDKVCAKNRKEEFENLPDALM